MKITQTILVLSFLICFNSYSQFPITEEFDPGTTWTFTNGAGIQNYGPPENYATFNVGNASYPNGSTVTITSPVYNLSACLGTMLASFPLQGVIENTYDFAYFQYRIGAGAWITVQSYTGSQNTTYTYSGFPNTTTQFRFLLITDGTVNTYFSGGQTLVYYYDIANISITCDIILPIELINFSCSYAKNNNLIEWTTASERNSDYFQIEHSIDGENWSTIATTSAAGNSSVKQNYSLKHSGYTKNTLNYYRLSAIDVDGDVETFDIITIKNKEVKKELLKIVNVLGQEISEDYEGLKIFIYKDGTTKKEINSNK